LLPGLPALTALAALAATCLSAQDFDLLIRNGRIADGTGNPTYTGDVGIKDGRVAAIGRLEGKSAARTIDAAGLTVTPGFVDIHNHSDFTILQDGDAESMIRQGVTTMIFGEGGSAAPSKDFPDLRAYFSKVLGQGVSTNIGTYVGSSQVWVQVR